MFQASPVNFVEMHSLAQEIHGFAKDRLKKQCTRVTTVTGKKLLERRSDGGEGDVELVEELEDGNGCGFVEDNSLDLQVGVVRPFLLLGNLCSTILTNAFFSVLIPPHDCTILEPDRYICWALLAVDPLAYHTYISAYRLSDMHQYFHKT